MSYDVLQENKLSKISHLRTNEGAPRYREDAVSIRCFENKYVKVKS